MESLLQGDRLQSCLEDLYLSWDLGVSVEEIVRRIRKPIGIRINCAEQTFCRFAGCAPRREPDGREFVELERENLSATTTKDLASLIAHEITHNKGFAHPREPDPRDMVLTVTEQVEACVANFNGTRSGNGERRSEFERETELAHVGGGWRPAFRTVLPFGKARIWSCDSK